MAIKTTNAVLRNKIISGIKKAARKLVEQCAAENSTLVVLVNGKPCEVSTQELLNKKK